MAPLTRSVRPRVDRLGLIAFGAENPKVADDGMRRADDTGILSTDGVLAAVSPQVAVREEPAGGAGLHHAALIGSVTRNPSHHTTPAVSLVLMPLSPLMRAKLAKSSGGQRLLGSSQKAL